MVQLWHPYTIPGKNITLTRWTFFGKVMSLLFNKLSRLVIAFLPRSKHLLLSWLQSPSAVILEPKKIKCHCFPIYLPWSDFSSSHVWMWELDYKECWALKNWCFWTVVLEKTLESPPGCKEMKPVHPKGNQSWIFIRRTDAEALILWPPDMKCWIIRTCPDTGKDWRQEEKGMTEDKSGGWRESPTQWTWVWASSRKWWRTGKPGVLQSMGLQTVGHD